MSDPLVEFRAQAWDDLDGVHLQLARGFLAAPTSRGVDYVVARRAGRLSGNRKADVLTVVAEGFVTGDDPEDFQANRVALMAVLDESDKDPGLLLVRPPYLGLDAAGGNAWIYARVKNYVEGPIVAEQSQTFSIELESVDPYWTRGTEVPAPPSPTESVPAYTSAAWTVWRVSWTGGSIGGTPASWPDVGFDDSGWDVPHEFGVYAPADPGHTIAPQEAFSSTTDNGLVWLARSPEFTLANVPISAVIDLAHDDAIEVYVNGTLVYSSGSVGSATGVAIDETAFVAGTNVIAAKVTNISTDPSWAVNPTLLALRLTVLS